MAVTDGGDWVKLTPAVSANGRLRDIGDAQIGRLQNLNGKLLRKKRDSDAESLIPMHDGFAVTFEQRHRLWLYRGGTTPFRARPENIRLPEIIRAMPRNGGLETLARLRDGRLVIIAEDFPKDVPYVKGWFFENKKWQGFRYRRHASYQPTGATTLPNGELLILERHFSLIGGFGSRLVTVAPDMISPNANVTGREVAQLEWPFITENFEGAASYRNAKGQTVIYLISDDNFLVLQNTILLKFLLEP